MQAYCLKCRTKREMKNLRSVSMSNGRPATQGECSVCGTKMYKIVKKSDRAAGAVTKALNKSWLSNVPEDKVFWCHDGRIMKNLEELGAGLQQMAEETFRYHVTEQRNDFSKWVQDVIGDYELSTELQNTGTKGRAAKVVADRIAWLKKSGD